MCVHGYFNHSPLYFLRPCLTLGSGAHQLGSTDGLAGFRNPPFSTSPALGLQVHTVVPRFLCGCWGPELASMCLCSKLRYLPARWLLLYALTVSTPLGSGLPPFPVHCHYWSFPAVLPYAPHLVALWPLGRHTPSLLAPISTPKVQLCESAVFTPSFLPRSRDWTPEGYVGFWGQGSVWCVALSWSDLGVTRISVERGEMMKANLSGQGPMPLPSEELLPARTRLIASLGLSRQNGKATVRLRQLV